MGGGVLRSRANTIVHGWKKLIKRKRCIFFRACIAHEIIMRGCMGNASRVTKPT